MASPLLPLAITQLSHLFFFLITAQLAVSLELTLFSATAAPVLFYQGSVQVQNGPNAALVSAVRMKISSHTQ